MNTKPDIIYVDADHKFGKTVVYIDIEKVSENATHGFKDEHLTIPFSDDEKKELTVFNTIVKDVSGDDILYSPVASIHDNEVGNLLMIVTSNSNGNALIAIDLGGMAK